MSWFKGWTRNATSGPICGITLLQAIDSIDPPLRPREKPLRLPLQDVFKLGGGVGTVAVGRVETGVIKKGMELVFAPTGVEAVVKSLQMHHEAVDEAAPGDNVGFSLDLNVR